MNITDKGILIGLGVVAIGIGAYFGIKKIRKNKAEKKANEEVDFDALMKKQYEEEVKFRSEKLEKEAEEMVKQNPVTREDLARIIANDPEFAKVLAKYISPVQIMAMKHMPSIQDIIKNDGAAAVENFKNEIGLNNTCNRSESVADTIKHVKDYNRGLEYDVKMPLDSVHDVSNIKPLTEEVNNANLKAYAQSVHNEVYDALSTLSEDDQIALARRVFDGHFIAVCGKKVTLQDIPAFNDPKLKTSPKILAAMSEMIQQRMVDIAANTEANNVQVQTSVQPVVTEEPVQTQPVQNQSSNSPFIERGTPVTQKRMEEILLEDMEAKETAMEIERKTAEDYNKWLKAYKGGFNI